MGRGLSPPVVCLAEGGEAAGLAAMVADLLEANLASSCSRARLIRCLEGIVVLHVADRDLGVSLEYESGRVTVRGIARADVPRLSGAWEAMAQVCSGRRSPLAALLRRELSIERRRHLRRLLVTAYALKVPRSAYRRPLTVAKLAKGSLDDSHIPVWSVHRLGSRLRARSRPGRGCSSR